MSITSIVEYFYSLLSHPDTFDIARKQPNYFIRESKLGLPGLLKFMFSRNGHTVSNEINHYFSGFDALDKSVSKQAIFQAQEKLSYKVFPYLNHQLCQYYYNNNEYDTIKGYTAVAIDGSTGEAPDTLECIKAFGDKGLHKHQQRRTNPRISGFYDICNGIYINLSIQSYRKAELPMAYEQMDDVHQLLDKQKRLFLADRNYDASDLFFYFEMNNDFYCFRGKPNFYKKHLQQIEEDGWINVEFDDQWINRFKIDEVREYARKHRKLRIRVIKYKKSEIKKLKKNEEDEEIILFTNLSSDEWPRKEIIVLYGHRWTEETGYDTLKNKLEMERITSEKPELILQEMHSQVLVHNLAAMIKKESDKIVVHTPKYKYQTNINNLIQLLRANLPKLLNQKQKIKELLEKIIKKAAKNKEPIRPNRLYPRWGVYIKLPSPLKFRVDGRRNPSIKKVKNKFLRIKS